MDEAVFAKILRGTDEALNDHRCDITKANRISRATWVCPQCGADVSMHYVFWQEAEERARQDKADRGKHETR